MHSTQTFVTLSSGYKLLVRQSTTGTIPLLMLHGGPGMTFDYFEPFWDRFAGTPFKLIMYNQLGSYGSDQPDDQSLWTIERFANEVEDVRQALNLGKIFLYGHSWGGTLALEYALKYHEQLLGLIVSNMTASGRSFEDSLQRCREALPAEVVATMKSYEDQDDYQNPIYQELLFNQFYLKHACQLPEWPAHLMKSYANINVKVYHYLWGKNDFVINGPYKLWDRWKDLSRINVPTLLIGGEFDFIDPQDLTKMASLMPQAQLHIVNNASHSIFYEQPDEYFRTLIEFLTH